MLIAAHIVRGMIMSMGHDPTKRTTPDLFATAAVHDASAPTNLPAAEATTETATKRYVLPKDLPAALKRLSDSELALMHASTLDEMKRRGKLPHGVETDLQTLRNRFDVRPNLPKASSRPTKNRQNVDTAEVPLTRGQWNASSRGIQGWDHAFADCSAVWIVSVRCEEGVGGG